jgi:hypothetical protein
MNQPMFTFSPDGVSVYAFSPSAITFKIIAGIFLAFIVMLALALVKLAEMASSFVNFLLTSPEPVLIRFLAFVLALALAFALVQYLRFRSLSPIPMKAEQASC